MADADGNEGPQSVPAVDMLKSYRIDVSTDSLSLREVSRHAIRFTDAVTATATSPMPARITLNQKPYVIA
jgi:hypothetical protein